MKRILTFLTALTLVSSVVFAQDAVQSEGETLSFSLSDAIDYALEHNRSLQNASLSIRQAQADRWTSIASMLPQASANLGYSSNFGYEMEMMGASIAMPASGTLGISVSMAVSGAQIVGSLLGNIAIDMADVTRQQTEQQIAEQVKLLYYSALVSQQTQELLEKNLETIAKLHAFSQKSVDVGVAEQVDADQILVQMATLETSLNESKRSLEMVYNSLRLSMNIPFDKEIVLTQTLEELLDVEKSIKLLYDDFIIENNYSYQLALKGTELAKQQKNLAEWAYGPVLAATYQYNAKTYFGEKAGFNMTVPNMFALQLQIPIFSSGANFESVKKAKVEYQKQQNNLEDAEMALHIQHRQLKYNLSSAYERYATQLKSVEVSQSVFDNISKKYEFGYSSSLDVTTAATNLIAAQSGYVQAALQYVNAMIELEKLLNKDYKVE